MNSDLDMVRHINGLAGRVRPVDLMLDLITRYGHWAFLIYGILLWLAPGEDRERRRQSCVTAFLTVCVCSCISFLIGRLWHRERPFTKDWRIWNFTGHKANASFPSNHTMNGAAVAFQLLRDRMPGAWWMSALSGLLAFSRIFAGMHYPTDLLGGMGIAAAVHHLMNHGRVLPFMVKITRFLSLVSDRIFFFARGR